MSEKTIYDVDRAKFEGFGTYKLPIEERVNEIMEATKKEYPNVDNYLLWLCAVDYVLEEKGLKKENEDGVKMYEEYLEQRKIFIYNTVKVVDDDIVKYDYNVLPARGGMIHSMDHRAQEV
jgi:DNA-binding transcriptional ArsR family regulator